MFRATRCNRQQTGRRNRNSLPCTRPSLESLEDRTLLSAGALDPTFGDGGLVEVGFRSETDDLLTDVAVSTVQPDGKIVVAGTMTPGFNPGSNLAVIRYNPDGSVDTTFGDEGRAITGTAFLDSAEGLALQEDGKIVLAGSNGIVRLNNDGSLDRTFAGIGIKFLSLSLVRDVAIQDDGKILVGGADSGDFTVLRLNPDGTFDTGFGTGGTATTDLGGFDVIEAVGLDQDKIVVAGRAFGSLALARYNADGTPDTSLDGDGVVVFDGVAGALDLAVDGSGRIVTAGFSTLARVTRAGVLDSDFDGDGVVSLGLGARAVAIQPDGNIVVAGGGFDFAVARYSDTGAPDLGFDTDGIAVTDFGATDQGRSVAIQNDGNIVVAGFSGGSFSNRDFALARYEGDGSLDSGFGEGGLVITDVGDADYDEARNLTAVQADGKVVVVGTTRSAEDFFNIDFAVARLNADGTPDTSFGDDGKVTTSFGDSRAIASAVAIQDDGKILVAGPVFSGDFTTFLSLGVARYNSDGSLDPTFDGDGTVRTHFGAGGGLLFDVRVENDGKILLFAVTNSGLTRVRYNADGILDTTFGNGGIATSPTPVGTTMNGAVGPDGKIALVGRVSSAPFAVDYVVTLYNSDGTLDTTFSQDGVVITDFGSGFEQPSGVAFGPGGSIIVVGYSTVAGNSRDFLVARYLPNGDLDNTFNRVGFVTTDLGGDDLATAVLVQASGKIVVTGAQSNQSDFILIRYDSDGGFDDQFAGDGIVTTDFGNSQDTPNALISQPDGKILVAGSTRALGSTPDNFAIARYEGVSSADASILKIVEIISEVQTLVDGGTLNQGQGGSLLRKLESAIQQIDENKTTAGVNKLDALINEVEDLVADGILTPEQGQLLINLANEAIALASGEALLAASPAPVGAAAAIPLTQSDVDSVLDAAMMHWSAIGVDTSALANVSIRITDLPGTLLGLATDGAVLLDSDAAGWGWFVDRTPWNDSEFFAPGDQGEQDRVDLLSVLMHEIGHLLGHDHDDEGVMQETLDAGARLSLNDSHGSELGEVAFGTDRRDQSAAQWMMTDRLDQYFSQWVAQLLARKERSG